MPRVVPRTTTDLSATALQTSVDDLEGRLTAARAAGLDELVTTGLLASGTDQVPIIRPTLGSATTITAHGTSWTATGWTEMVAANVLTQHSLVAAFFGAGTNDQYQVEIAEGGAGAEAVIWRFGRYGLPSASTNDNGVQWLPMPRIVTANARIAARVFAGGSSSAVYLYLMFLPRPF